MDKNQKKRTTILLIILGVVLVVAIAAYLIFMSGVFNKKGNEETVATKECGTIEAVDGKIEGAAPFAPNLAAKLTGSYDQNVPSCVWSIDDSFYATSKPTNGSCLFSEQSLATVGTHTISYKVVGLTGCPQTIKVTVTK